MALIAVTRTYKDNAFWQQVSDIVGEPLRVIFMKANTYDRSWRVVGAYVQVQIGVDVCELQVTTSNTPLGVASIIQENEQHWRSA